MDQNHIMFMGSMDNSYIMIDLNQNNKFFGYEDSCNYYNIDVKKILLIKNRYNEYFIRCYDVNKMKFVPLQLKINNSYNEINTLANNNRVIIFYNDDKEFFRKCIEIWDRIIELISKNNHIYFLKTNDDSEIFIMADVYKGTSFVLEDNYGYGHTKKL